MWYNMLMNHSEKLQFLAKYRWLVVFFLALICAGISVSIFQLPFLLTTIILSAVGLLFAYHKSIWLALFFLSNLPTFVSSLFADGQHFSSLDIVIFFVIFFFTLLLSYLIARKYDLIPKLHWKYFSLPKMVVGFLLIFLVSLLTGFFAQITKQSPTTANQAALDELQKMIPLAVFSAQTLGAAFLEELVYRVGIFELVFKKQKLLAFLCALLLFAFMHGPSDLYSWLTYGLMSLVLTGMYAKYRNFYLNFGIHFLWNFFGLALTFLIK